MENYYIIDNFTGNPYDMVHTYAEANDIVTWLEMTNGEDEFHNRGYDIVKELSPSQQYAWNLKTGVRA